MSESRIIAGIIFLTVVVGVLIGAAYERGKQSATSVDVPCVVTGYIS